MHDIPVYRIEHLVVENHHAIQHGHVQHSGHAARILRDADSEQVVALMLDGENWLVGIHYLAIGPFETYVAHPRQVFHRPDPRKCQDDHPRTQPHERRCHALARDRAVTRRLVAAGKLLGIDVRDHLIVGEGLRFYSFLEAGLLDDRAL